MYRSLAPLPSHGSPNGAAILDGARAPVRPLLGLDFQPQVDALVIKQLQVLADHGLTLTRSVLPWPDLMPVPDRVDGFLLDRFGNFLDLHWSFGVRTIPTLLRGNGSSPGWRQRRDRYADTWFVGRQAWLAEQVARRYAGHPALAGWLIAGDGPRYTGPGAAEAVRSWARQVIQGLRAGGATEPVSVGDGGHCADLVDWVGARADPTGDGVRPHLRAAFQCELAGTAGKAVLLDGFGPDAPGHYYRQLLHSTLLAGATGWIAGTRTDLDDLSDDALREMAGFRAVLDDVAVHRCTRAPAAVCVVLPSHVDTADPAALGAVEQAYLACRKAGTPPALSRESPHWRAAGCLLYLLPSVTRLTAPGWRRLAELADGGATVYVSYVPGAADDPRGPWNADGDRLFGVRHQQRPALADQVGTEPVRLTLRDDLGNLTAGTELCFATGADPARRAYLPVEPIEAQVLATDQAGRPALLHRPVGAGAIVFCCYPLEAMAATAAAPGLDDTWRLYAALAHAAGAHPVVRVDEPRVLVDCLDRDDGTRFVWLVSEAATTLSVTPRTQANSRLYDLRSRTPVSTVEIPPFGVRVLHT